MPRTIEQSLNDNGYFDITRGIKTATQLRWSMIEYLTEEIGLDQDELIDLTDEELLEKIIY